MLAVCVEFEKIEGRGIICTLYRRIRCGVHLDDGNDKHCNNDRFVFLPIGGFNDIDFDGLLLRQTGIENGQYERVGMFSARVKDLRGV
jgi:hypothetical protein